MSDAIEEIFEVVTGASAEIRGALAERRSYQDEENPSGDVQIEADVYADEVLEERLLALDAVGSYASEEREAVVDGTDGHLHVTCDPLDGSSNLKSNNGMGTVVGIYDEPLPAAGEALVAAGYVVYGPITTMMIARDGTVTEYLVQDGEREVLNDDVTIPEEPVVYGFGGRAPDWTDAFADYVETVEADRLKLRYGGAMVTDVNQVAEYGGIFGYPMLADTPAGKLRLQFEGIPIAHVIETMGGASSDGEQSLLAKTPDRLHERTPVFVGNGELIDSLESALQ